MMKTSDGVVIVREDVCRDVVNDWDAFVAVEGVFAAMAAGDAVNFPVVREAIGHADALYGFKSGFDRAGMALGVKSGGYWPQNMANAGISNHQSSVFLFDPDTGRLQAIIGGNYLTAVRTAAAAAVSISHLARPDASVLGMMGAGHQSVFQLRAALQQRQFSKILGWNRSADALSRLAKLADEYAIPFEAVTPDAMTQADVIVTITSSHQPLLMADQVSPGTHLVCMGTDTKGKQEIDPALFSIGTCFTDEVAQSVTIGEAQHAITASLVSEGAIVPIGSVINKDHAGRTSDDEITIFDGTGVGLQDLALASVAMRRAIEAGSATTVSF
jgi:ornithine cyclodeaminase